MRRLGRTGASIKQLLRAESASLAGEMAELRWRSSGPPSERACEACRIRVSKIIGDIDELVRALLEKVHGNVKARSIDERGVIHPAFGKGAGSQFGLGDTTQSLFFSPSHTFN